MTVYAKDTVVSVARSRAEIEESITRYGATKFMHFMEEGRAIIVFEATKRRVMFELPLPSRDGFKTRTVKTTQYGSTRTHELTPDEQAKAWEQACRQRWRALALVIKAKLEAVASGITTFEDEFLAHVVLPNGKTVGRWLAPQLEAALSTDKMPPMLTAGHS